MWYKAVFGPDRIYFTSNISRNHSKYITDNPTVAGAILNMDLDALGQKVQGVVFTGHAQMCPQERLRDALDSFIGRWPNSESALNYDAITSEESPNRLYEVTIDEWILHDEVHDAPGGPRYVLPGE
jgi:hypothetical protein